jgi:signal peptidase I
MDYILQYSIFILILSVLLGLSSFKLYQKMGYKGWEAFVPFYNYYIIQKEVGEPKWWVILAYLPIVGPIMMTVFHLFLMKKFGRTSALEQILTALLPFIYLAYSSYFQLNKVDRFAVDDPKAKKESFIGSITFAVVFATIIHAFVTQPFAIPTGSMERTLLVGDFLFVNKWSYGYRMPMRPVALPFLQGTIMDTQKDGNPKNDPKSYVDAIKLPYFRIGEFKKPKKNDIVVFNYPGDSVHTAIDRKDPYVKRCVAVGGDVVEMRAGNLYINGKPEVQMADAEVQRSYTIYTRSEIDIDYLWKNLAYLPITDEGETKDGLHYYQFQGLTKDLLAQIKAIPEFVKAEEVLGEKGKGAVSYYPVLDENSQYVNDGTGHALMSKKVDISQSIFPINKPWNQDWYGPLTIPKKGDVITITQENLPEYKKLITEFEGNILEFKGGKFYINGAQTDKYTVKQDYYFMMGDNRDASLDARFFGFVPETHIVGSPMFTWLSLQGTFDEGPKKVRWERMFKATNTGEKEKTSYWWVAAAILILFFGWEFFVKLFKGKNKEEE